jgi:hypothetical protein
VSKPDRCWRCSRCGWVGCYSAKDVAKYGEPSECQNEYHESLDEIDPAEGFAVLADEAHTKVREAQRALQAAERAAAEADQKLALAGARA